MKQDLKWIAYTRSFTADLRSSKEERSELLWTIFGAVVVFTLIWKLLNL